MARAVWKGPFVEESLMKKLISIRLTQKNTNQNLVKKINNNSRLCWCEL